MEQDVRPEKESMEKDITGFIPRGECFHPYWA